MPGLCAVHTDPCDNDTDGDRCGDGAELGPDEAAGGRRDPLNFWDFYDVTGDGAIDLDDVIDVLSFFGNSALPETPGNLRDRDFVGSEFRWQTYETDDGVDIYDAIVNMESFGHNCAAVS